MALEKSTPYRNAWYRDLLEKEKELKEYTDEKVAQAIELPEVTNEDDGDLLAADDGSWVKSDKLKTIMNAGVEQIGKIPMVGAQGNWSLTDYPANELPSVSNADNGKVAGVVNGNWDKMDIPNELPVVTGADDGKVLGVISGAWAKVLQSKEIMFFNCTDDSSSIRPILDNDKTVADLNTAFDNGYLVIVKEHNNEYIMVEKLANGRATLIRNSYQNSVGSIFYLIGSSTTSSYLDLYTTSTVPVPIRTNSILRSDGTKWVEEFDRVPAASASDNGKILAVINGVWAKSVPNLIKSVQFVNGQALSDNDYASIKANTNVHGIYSDASKYIIFELSSCNFAQTEFEFVNYAEGLKATIDTTKTVTIVSI